jgi:hypothetical protein
VTAMGARLNVLAVRKTSRLESIQVHCVDEERKCVMIRRRRMGLGSYIC